MRFQLGSGSGWLASVGGELVESRGGILVKEKGIVRIEFNEFNDHEEGD